MVNSGSKTSKVFKQSNKTIKDKNNIMNIIFKDINDDYAWAKYGDFKVIIMKENGYINATKICNDAKTKNGTKKELKHWKENSVTKDLMKEINGSVGYPTDPLFINIVKGPNELRGTYAHPDLIPHIASWASPQFAVRVSKILNKYFIKKALKEKEKEIKKKDDKIDKLNVKVDELLTNNKELITNNKELLTGNKELLSGNKELLTKNKKMDKRIKRLLTKNDDLYDQNEEILNKVDTISNDRVVTTGDSNNDHMLIIIKNNDNPEEFDEDDILYDYHALRLMKKSYKQRLIGHKNRHPNMDILMKISYSPNAMNLWTRIKQKLGAGKNKKLKYDNCKFNLTKKYTLSQ
jgi:FtsZ-binding cell division protein ZapB